MNKAWRFCICGAASGAVCGLLGAGGGMVLVPLLTLLTDLKSEELFPCSVAVMLPIVLTSLLVGGIAWSSDFLPYLTGSLIGGLLAGFLGSRISPSLLHKGFGLLVLWAGVKNLWGL